MTITAFSPTGPASPAPTVYLPREDSRLLIETLEESGVAAGRSVLDLCTGTGVVAIAAARLGASCVTAWDICPHAVRHSRANAAAAAVEVDVRLGTWAGALGRRFDVVVANPPYVPADPSAPVLDGPARAWDAGLDGRLVVDPLCAAAPDLLTPDGTLLFVQSGLTGVDQSLAALTDSGLVAKVVARQHIPFGPVLMSRVQWLEQTGRSPVGSRIEELVVIRADRP